MMSEIIMGDSYSDTKLMSSLSAVSLSSNPSVLLNLRINFIPALRCWSRQTARDLFANDALAPLWIFPFYVNPFFT